MEYLLHTKKGHPCDKLKRLIIIIIVFMATCISGTIFFIICITAYISWHKTIIIMSLLSLSQGWPFLVCNRQ